MALTERSLTVQVLIVESYWAAKPQNKKEFADWAERTADELNLKLSTVVRYAKEQETEQLRQIQGAIASQSQLIADNVGATATAAMQVLAEGLAASKCRTVKDSHGNVQKGPDGQALVEEQPDWTTRAKCAELILKVHQGFAPERIEIDQRVQHINLPDAELIKRLDAIQLDIARVTAKPAKVIEGGRGAPGRGEVPASDRGSVLLDDGMHQDEGRAG